ncbi:hypothetical protein K1719_003331 [Acacia pycnantha]|nr:hypothetical protein K1719_003331 [Acacia pycnantha]
MLLQSLLSQKEGKSNNVILDLQKAKSMLEEPLSIFPLDGLAEATPLAIQLHCIFLLEEDCKLRLSHEKAKQAQSILNFYVKLVPSSISKIHQDCSPWLKVLRAYQTMFSTSPISLKL